MCVFSGETVVLINPGLGDRLICSATDQLISSYEAPEEVQEQAVQWGVAEDSDREQGQRLILKHPKVPTKHKCAQVHVNVHTTQYSDMSGISCLLCTKVQLQMMVWIPFP